MKPPVILLGLLLASGAGFAVWQWMIAPENPMARNGSSITAASGDRSHRQSSISPAGDTDTRFKSSRPRVHADPDPVEKKLRAIILPRIDFEDVSVEEAVDFLRLRTTEITRGMAENAEEEMAGLPGDKTRSPLEGLDERLLQRRITLQRTDISAWDAMSLIAREIGMKVTVVDGSLVLGK